MLARIMNGTEKIGRIDEAGYLKGFARRGYTKPKCLLELTANCLDSFDLRPAIDSAQRKEICYSVGQQHIRIIDNAAGMGKTGLNNMYAMHGENHVSESSRGVSGAGGKVAQSILGNKTLVKVLTHQRDGSFICAVAPWDKIHKEGKYTDMVEQREMTAEERAIFVQERRLHEMLMADEEAVGTTIEFCYNSDLADLISENFTDIEDSTLNKPLDRIQIVFGHEIVKFTHTHFESTETMTLKLYNYFGDDKNNYYCGISVTRIDQMERDDAGVTETLFIAHYNGRQVLITKNGRGYSREPEILSKNLQLYTKVGEFEHYVGLRIDAERIFDLNNPRLLTASNIVPTYDEPFLGDNNESFLIENKLVRNNQLIGTFMDPDTKVGNARADGQQSLAIRLVQSELRFFPYSRQDNPQDHIVGIQENKNQFSGKDMPTNLTRLIRWLNKKKSDKIWEMIEKKVKAAQHVPAPPALDVDVDVFEEDENEDDESEVEQKEIEQTNLDAFFVQQQSAQVAEPPVEVSEPPVEVAEAPVEVSEPPVDIVEAPVEVSEAPVEVSEAPVEVSEPPVEVAEAPAEVSEPPVEVAEAPAEVSEPPVEVSETAPADSSPPVPINVSGYRRGAVMGNELKKAMMEVYSAIDDDAQYTNPDILRIFNLLCDVDF